VIRWGATLVRGKTVQIQLVDTVPEAEAEDLRHITVQQFCELFNVSEHTAYKAINEGLLESVTLFRRRLISLKSAKALVASMYGR
jgi:hypothetical protein